MNKLLSIVLLFLIGCSSPEPINADELLYERNNASVRYFSKATDKPYSGEIYKGRGDSKSYIATLKNGYPEKYTEYYLWVGEDQVKLEGERYGYFEGGFNTHTVETEYYPKDPMKGIGVDVVKETLFEDSKLYENITYYKNGNIQTIYKWVKNGDEPPLNEIYYFTGELAQKRFYVLVGDNWEIEREEFYSKSGGIDRVKYN